MKVQAKKCKESSTNRFHHNSCAGHHQPHCRRANQRQETYSDPTENEKEGADFNPLHNSNLLWWSQKHIVQRQLETFFLVHKEEKHGMHSIVSETNVTLTWILSTVMAMLPCFFAVVMLGSSQHLTCPTKNGVAVLLVIFRHLHLVVLGWKTYSQSFASFSFRARVVLADALKIYRTRRFYSVADWKRMH